MSIAYFKADPFAGRSSRSDGESSPPYSEWQIQADQWAPRQQTAQTAALAHTTAPAPARTIPTAAAPARTIPTAAEPAVFYIHERSVDGDLHSSLPAQLSVDDPEEVVHFRSTAAQRRPAQPQRRAPAAPAPGQRGARVLLTPAALSDDCSAPCPGQRLQRRPPARPAGGRQEWRSLRLAIPVPAWVPRMDSVRRRVSGWLPGAGSEDELPPPTEAEEGAATGNSEGGRGGERGIGPADTGWLERLRHGFSPAELSARLRQTLGSSRTDDPQCRAENGAANGAANGVVNGTAGVGGRLAARLRKSLDLGSGPSAGAGAGAAEGLTGRLRRGVTELGRHRRRRDSEPSAAAAEESRPRLQRVLRESLPTLNPDHLAAAVRRWYGPLCTLVAGRHWFAVYPVGCSHPPNKSSM